MRKSPNGSLGCNLAHHRRENGLTQYDLAERIHVARTHIAAVEQGKSYASAGVIKALAETLNVPIRQLLNGEDIPNRILRGLEEVEREAVCM